MDKRAYYSAPDVVRRYEAVRFGSAGGRYVDAVERQTVLRLLEGTPRNARVLDLPVGTGRMASSLRAAGFENVEGADSSTAMLTRAARSCTPALAVSQQDASQTSFADESFDVVVSFRFLFHHPDITPFLREFARILRPGGSLVFDVLRWSPRAWYPALQTSLGGPTHTTTTNAVRATLGECGFDIFDSVPILLAPSQLYRYLPAFVLRGFVAAERRLDPSLRTKIVYRACKRAE